MRKSTLKILPAVLLIISAVAEEILLPENHPWMLDFDHVREDPSVYYRVFRGTNLHQTVTTNDFLLLGATNGVSTLRITVDGSPKGTNLFSVVAVSKVYTNSPSDPSTNLTTKMLGKPQPPQGLRKP